MKPQKGMTLLEVLAAMAIIGMIVFATVHVLTQGVARSHREQRLDLAVNIGRMVMEEIKAALPSGKVVSLFDGQVVDPAVFKDGQDSATAEVLYYPSVNNKQFQVTVSSLPFQDLSYPFHGTNGPSYVFSLQQHFELMEVVVLDLSDPDVRFDLRSYVERK